MCLFDRFEILHLLSVMLWNFVKSFFKPEFFSEFFKKVYTFYFYKKAFYKKIGLKNPKTWRKYLENLQPQMSKQKLKTLIFPRALQKLQIWVNFSFFSNLKFFCFSIIKKMTFINSVKPNQKKKKKKQGDKSSEKILRKSQPDF